MKRPFLLSVLFVVLLALTLPYAAAALSGGSDSHFIGFLINPIDGASYLAKMYQGWSGSWRFTLPYTAEAEESAYIFLYYLLLGHLSRLSGISLIGMFHLARLAGAGFLLAALYHFYAIIFGNRQFMLNLAFGLSVIGAGMGWLIVFFGPLPSDFWVAEAYPFLSMFANPHFPLGLALMVWAFTLLTAPEGRFRCLKLALIGLLISAILQFALVVTLVVVAAWMVWTWLETKRLLWQPFISLGILGGPFLVYQYVAIIWDPILAGWNAQNLTPGPSVGDFIISFSPVLPLAVWGAFQILKQKGVPLRRLLVAWLIIGPVMVSIPFTLQRRFILGYYIPAAVLAVYALADLASRWPAWRRRLPAMVLALAIPTNLFLILIGMAGVAVRAPVLFMTGDEALGMAWIREQTPDRAVVLAAPETGRLIPAFTGRRVLYGHPYETLNASREETQVLEFFEAAGWDRSMDRYLTEKRVDFLFYGPREQALGGDLDLSNLAAVFETGQVRIYAVETAP